MGVRPRAFIEGMAGRQHSRGTRLPPHRCGAGLHWLLTDHLGSTAVVATSSGAWAGELRYTAWGETRESSGALPTDYRFTDQRWQDRIGLYDYQARWYDPSLGHFVQPDTIVPEPGNPQSLNRYTYVLDSPTNLVDPTGRVEETEELVADQVLRELLESYDVVIQRDWGLFSSADGLRWEKGAWTLHELRAVLRGVQMLAASLAGAADPDTSSRVFREVMGARSIIIERWDQEPGPPGWLKLADVNRDTHTIRLFNCAFWGSWVPEHHSTVIHELAHFWDWAAGGQPGEKIDDYTHGERAPTRYAREAGHEHFAETAKLWATRPGALGHWQQRYMALVVQGVYPEPRDTHPRAGWR